MDPCLPRQGVETTTKGRPCAVAASRYFHPVDSGFIYSNLTGTPTFDLNLHCILSIWIRHANRKNVAHVPEARTLPPIRSPKELKESAASRPGRSPSRSLLGEGLNRPN